MKFLLAVLRSLGTNICLHVRWGGGRPPSLWELANPHAKHGHHMPRVPLALLPPASPHRAFEEGTLRPGNTSTFGCSFKPGALGSGLGTGGGHGAPGHGWGLSVADEAALWVTKRCPLQWARAKASASATAPCQRCTRCNKLHVSTGGKQPLSPPHHRPLARKAASPSL